MSEWITINAAASYVKIGCSTLYRLARSGVVPAHKIGRSWRFSIPELDNWIRSEPGNVSPGLNGALRSGLPRSQPMRIIDLFCGAGGLTLGFTRLASCPAVSVWANDFNRFATETYNANFGSHCVDGDIIDLLADPKNVIPQADIVIGGPPCQGFSLLNKNRDNDPRKQLWRPYMEVVRRSGAEIFVMENVPQLLGTVEHGEIIEAARQAGFKTTAAVLCAADYGVPQTRKRAFILGCSFADPSEFFPPRKTHYNPSKKPANVFQDDFSEYVSNPKLWATVHDAIADLKPPMGVEIRNVEPPYNLHFGRTPTEMSLRRYKAIPKEGMNRFDLQRNLSV